LTVFRRRSHFQPRRRFAPALTKNFGGGGGATGAAQGSTQHTHKHSHNAQAFKKKEQKQAAREALIPISAGRLYN